jgi:hypothetical protein
VPLAVSVMMESAGLSCDALTSRGFGFEAVRLPAHGSAVCIVHPRNDEEAWWRLFHLTQKHPEQFPLFPELMAELDALKESSVIGIDGLMIRRDHSNRHDKVPLPWPTPNGDLRFSAPSLRGLFPRLDFVMSCLSRLFGTEDLLRARSFGQ